MNKAAMALIDNGLVDFIGTDLHNPNQLAVIENAMIPVSLFEKLQKLNLLNNSLL